MLNAIVKGWNRFFFEPQRPTPVALFRIVFGIINIANLALLWPEWLTWFGAHPFMSIETMSRLSHGPRLNLFVLIPRTDLAANIFFWAFLACSITLTLGFMTRFSCVAVYLCLMSVHERNYFILNGADTVMTVTGFFLMFAPADGALSIDRLRRIWTGREGPEVPLYSPWAQRMIQLQISVAYCSTFLAKITGKTWRGGTAIYYALHLDGFRRFPVPFTSNLMFTRLMSWGTLAIEFSAGTLVWIRRLRYAVLLAAFALHMGIEYSMNLPIFEWIMVSTYVTFIYPEDLTRAWAWISERFGPMLGAPATVVYDGASNSSLRKTNTLKALDVFHRLHFVDARSEEGAPLFPAAEDGAVAHPVRFLTPSGPLEGFAGLRAISPLIPMLWPLAIPSLLGNGVPRTAPAKQ
jgi:vitamin K-dependent gamma-carboxylase-like protein